MKTEQQKFIDYVMKQNSNTKVAHNYYKNCYIGHYLKDTCQEEDKTISNYEGADWAHENLSDELNDLIGSNSDIDPLSSDFSTYGQLQDFLIASGYINSSED